MKPLNPYGTDTEGMDLSFAGEMITDEKVAFDFALGNLNISGRKLEKVSDYDPEAAPIVENPSYGKRASHTSMWTKGISNSSSKVDQSQQKTPMAVALGPTPNKELSNQANLSQHIAESSTNPKNHKTVVNLKSKEKVYYVSKYFKNKLRKENENDGQDREQFQKNRPKNTNSYQH